MALPERKTPSERAPLGLPTADIGYQPGGHVGQMQADLVHRLARQGLILEPAGTSPGERLIRFMSVAGGFVALLAGYAGVALLFWR